MNKPRNTYNGDAHSGEKQDLLRGVFDSSFNAIVVVRAVRDTTGKIIDLEYILANDVANKYLGQNPVGKRFLDLYAGSSKTGQLEKYVQAIETGEPIDFDHVTREDGLNKWFRNTAAKLGDGLVIGLEDITERKKSEEEIRKQMLEKNRELAALNSEIKTFNSIAANDYKETLRQLYLSLEFIASNDGGQLSNSGRANVRRAQSAVQRMKLLTDDLVSYTKIQEVGVWEEKVDLNAILKDVLNDFDKRYFLVDAVVDCKPLPHISGYPFLISLVFHHLIENAIRFKQENRPPTVKVHCTESVKGAEVQHENARTDTIYHVVSVSDEGIGFPKTEAENIFGVFYRLDTKNRHKGSGIGLAICKKVMDMHQGFIIAESEPGQGSAFHCYFPFEARENPPE